MNILFKIQLLLFWGGGILVGAWLGHTEVSLSPEELYMEMKSR